MAATLTEIAQPAGVSVGTVSPVLNGKAKEARPSSVKRANLIRQIAEECGYRPNQAARNIRAGSFGALGLLTSSDPLAQSFDTHLLHGIQAELGRVGERLMMCELPPAKFHRPDTIPAVLRESSVDGLLVSYLYDLPDAIIEAIDRSRVPYVWLNAKNSHNCVHPDDFAGGVQAAERLISLGHRRIGYVSLHEQEVNNFRHYSVYDRRDGFLKAMEDHGLEPASVEVGGGFVFGGGVSKVRDMLTAEDRPTALICYEQHEAVAAWVAAAELGISIPEDLSIIGFHAEPLRKTTGLPITTFVVPSSLVGSVAVQMLREEIETAYPQRPSRSIPFSMEEGRSCAPPTAR